MKIPHPLFLKYTVLTLFILLLAGSLIYYQERMLFCDASHMTLRILNTGQLLIGEYRYGSFITHLVPFFGNKLHWSLPTIVLWYSLSFNLFYLAVCLLLLFVFRNPALGLLMAFYYTLFAGDTYFWTNNEIHQAIAWMFLLFGLVLHFRQRRYAFGWHVLLFLPLAFLSLFTHPLMLIVVPFLWTFFITDACSNPYRSKEAVVLSMALMLIIVAKYRVIQYSGYDAPRARHATHFSLADIGTGIRSEMSLTFFRRLLTHYYFVPFLFFAGLYTAVKHRRYRKLAMVLAFSLAYYQAMALTFKDFVPFYMESEWMPFTLIGAALFVFETAPRMQPRNLLLLTIFILGTRLVYMGAAAEKFTARKEWLFGVLQKMKQQDLHKGYLYRDEALKALLIADWALPAESLLASALKGDHPNLTFCVDTRENMNKRVTGNRKEIIDSFGPLSGNELNRFYFAIDTTSGYSLVLPAVEKETAGINKHP